MKSKELFHKKKPPNKPILFGGFYEKNYLKSATTEIFGSFETFPAAIAPPFTP